MTEEIREVANVGQNEVGQIFQGGSGAGAAQHPDAKPCSRIARHIQIVRCIPHDCDFLWG